MAKLEFIIEGDKQISRNLRILAGDIKEMKKEMEDVGQALLEGVLDNFKQEQSETNGPWKKLAPSTVKARERRRGYYKKPPSSGAGGQGPILQWTGNLKSSLIKESGDLYALVGNTAKYFKYHQTKNGGKNLPRRVMLEIREGTKLKIQNIIAKGINRRVGNFGKQY